MWKGNVRKKTYWILSILRIFVNRKLVFFFLLNNFSRLCLNNTSLITTYYSASSSYCKLYNKLQHVFLYTPTICPARLCIIIINRDFSIFNPYARFLVSFLFCFCLLFHSIRFGMRIAKSHTQTILPRESLYYNTYRAEWNWRNAITGRKNAMNECIDAADWRRREQKNEWRKRYSFFLLFFQFQCWNLRAKTIESNGKKIEETH